MYLKRNTFALYVGLAIAAGFCAGYFICKNNIQSELTSGDISKVKLYSNRKDDPELTVIEEKLKNDQDFFNTTKASLTILQDRVNSLGELTERTISACNEIPVLADAIKDVSSLNAKSFNTSASLNDANNGIDKIAEGISAPEYEQASNNALVGFRKIENQIAIGKAFVDATASYLKDKQGAMTGEISDLLAEWSVYCVQDAVLNGNKSDVSFWREKFNEVGNSLAFDSSSSQSMKNAFNAFTALSLADKLTSVDNAMNGLSDQALNSMSQPELMDALKNALGLTASASGSTFQDSVSKAVDDLCNRLANSTAANLAGALNEASQFSKSQLVEALNSATHTLQSSNVFYNSQPIMALYGNTSSLATLGAVQRPGSVLGSVPVMQNVLNAAMPASSL